MLRVRWRARLDKVVAVQWNGMRQDKVVAATLVFEGTAAQVATQQRLVYAIGRRFGGIRAGATAGRRGYMMTFMIAYLRDFGLRYHVAGDSFETCVRWHQLLPVQWCTFPCCVPHGMTRLPPGRWCGK